MNCALRLMAISEIHLQRVLLKAFLHLSSTLILSHATVFGITMCQEVGNTCMDGQSSNKRLVGGANCYWLTVSSLFYKKQSKICKEGSEMQVLNYPLNLTRWY